MGIYVENNITYSGAGVLIIEDYYNRDGTVEPCIILVRNKASGEYTDFGGAYEKKHGSLQITAIKELREESLNLFNISIRFFINNINGIDNIDIPAPNNHFYRLYILKINGVSRKYFLHNNKLIDTIHQKGVHIPRYWRETDDISHIPINNIDFTNLDKRGKIILQDINGRNITINGRIKRGLHYGRKIIMKQIKQQPIAKRSDIIKYRSTDWLNNTYSYVLK